MATQELTFKINFDPNLATAEMRKFTSSVEANLRQVGVVEKQQAAVSVSVQRQTEAAKLRAFQQSINQIAREEQRRVSDAVKSANQRLREEQRAAREVSRINAETARQAIQQERIRERSAKQLADAQIREARRAARELEQSLAISQSGGGGGGNLLAITGALGRVPALSGLSSELSAVTTASASAGSATASMAGPIGLAVAAFLAEAAAVAAVTRGLFDLAKQTADYRGKLFDLSQQVGISVETLSALEVLAATTGGSIENVAASIAIFQRNLEASHDPTSKEAKLLRELGVSSTETEEALRQTLTALFAMGEGSAQTSAVLELFGRSGRFVNAILKESQGDLDKAIRKFRELGIIVSTEDAKAADEFNDTLATLNFQLRGLTALVGQQVMPIVLSVLTDLRKLLKENREAVEAIGLAAKVAAGLIAAPFKGAIIGLNAVLQEHKVELILIKELYEDIAALIKFVSGRIPDVSPTAIPEQPLGRVDGLKLLQDAQKAFLAGLKPFNLREIFGLDKEGQKAAADPGLSLLRQLQNELRRLTGETRAQEVAQQLLDEQFKNTNSNVREQIRVAANLIDIRRAQVEVERLIKEETDKRGQAIIQERDAINNFIFAQEIALKGANTELDRANRFIAQILSSSGNISGILDDATLRLIRFNALAADSAKRIKEMLDLMRETIELVPPPASIPAIDPDSVAGIEEAKRVQRELSVFIDEKLGGEQPPLPPPDFSLWKTAIAEVKKEMVDFNQFASGAIVDGINGIAGALAHGVEAWALYGESFGKAMKQALAASAARIAGEATFQGALHAAFAIGSLAFGDFSGAAKHAIAAAKFFAVAALAAVGARAIAGNTFQQGASSGGSGASGGSQSRGELNPLTLSRNSGTGGQPQQAPQIQPIRVVIEHRVNDSKFAKAITSTIVEDINNAGPIREVIAGDGNLNRG